MSSGDLAGLVILVTGAATSLGAAFSDHCEKQGATVWRTDIDTDGVGVHRLDVRQRPEWESSVGELIDTHGRIDGLVNNAAVFYGQRPFWDETDDELAAMIDVNIKGSWIGTQVVSKRMAAGGRPGSIVNLSSTSGVMGSNGFAGYGTTRWAVRGMSKFAAGDLAQYQIRVNSLHPHSVRGTGMMARTAEMLNMSQDDLDALARRSPLGRMGTTDDLAEMATFLLSDKSSFITGREFVVDGGATLMAAT
jgi:3alpha(or 20beta)-hydroxysteroid dehydrogenase